METKKIKEYYGVVSFSKPPTEDGVAGSIILFGTKKGAEEYSAATGGRITPIMTFTFPKKRKTKLKH